MELTIGNKINVLCNKYGIKKKDLAKDLGISAAFLSRVINGVDKPSDNLLNII